MINRKNSCLKVFFILPLLVCIYFPLSYCEAVQQETSDQEQLISSITLTISENEKAIIKRKEIPGSFFTEDVLTIIQTASKIENPVFTIQGQEITALEKINLDADNQPELLITTLSIGSGGYGDVIILQKKNGIYQQIWTDTFVSPKASVVNDTAKPNSLKLHINHWTSFNNTSEPVNIVSIFKTDASSTFVLESNINCENVAVRTPEQKNATTAKNLKKISQNFFPPILSQSKLALQKFSESERPLVFLAMPGYEAIYAPDEKSSEAKLVVATLELSNPSAASETFRFISSLDNLPEKKLSVLPEKISAISFKQGTLDSPNASADASPVASTKVVALFPGGFLLFINAYSDDIPEKDIIQILTEFDRSLSQ
ncbi:MAG: hypothetical protein HQM10_23270 [Candidatus Riflebacteria bacterium]|nr:hypothetical protein [Candidatus Riflebacteria bacterium]